MSGDGQGRPAQEKRVRKAVGSPVRGAGASPKSEERWPGISAIVETAIKRLEAVVDEETALLRQGAARDLKPFNERKSLALIELNRALRLMEGAEPDAALKRHLERLNAKLEANRHVLKLHVEAVREIAGIIAQSMRDAESDGTYSLAFRSKGPKP
ncbi:MAG: hypothetical protein HC850_04395 [Rhodomicrobium sp.]|nr:hypothetical protein [Rhodomicrobium sp.]